MSELMEKILAAKRAERERIVALPIEEKLVLLEKLRDQARTLRQAATRLKDSRAPSATGVAH